MRVLDNLLVPLSKNGAPVLYLSRLDLDLTFFENGFSNVLGSKPNAIRKIIQMSFN